MIKSKTQLQTDITANADFTSAQKTILTDAVDSYQNIFPQLTTVQRDALTPTTGLTVFNTDNARHEYWNGAQWLAVGTHISSCQVAKVTVSAAQLLDLVNTPVTLLPAPGAGYIAMPIAAIVRLTFATEAYDFEPGAVFVIANTKKEIYTERIQEFPSDKLNETATCIFGMEGGPDGPSDPLVENDSIVLFAQGDAPTQGDGSLTIYLLYSITPY